MTFRYVETSGQIVDDDDEGLIAELVETVDPEDGLKMAAAPDLYDALYAIRYACMIGNSVCPPMSEALVRANLGDPMTMEQAA